MKMKKILHLDCRSGASGDMLVGALVGLGFKRGELEAELRKLNIEEYKIDIKKTVKKGVKANSFTVASVAAGKQRNLRDILKIIDSSLLGGGVKKMVKKIFLVLADAEAKVHGTDISDVNFHEVGATDSIIDIVSIAILVDKLNPDKIYVSNLSDGFGKVDFCHGNTTLPVPAVRELLKGVPISVLRIDQELITPTGAAILRTIVDGFDGGPEMEVEKMGFGAGKKNLRIANVLKAGIGMDKMKENLVILETNIDDLNPEFFSYIIEKLMKAGAVESFIRPAVMKKDRIGTVLTVICGQDVKERMIEIIFAETSTFGIRVNKLSRVVLDRTVKKAKTEYGLIDVKIGKYKGKVMTISPEYETCKRRARATGAPIKKIYNAALNGKNCQ